MDFSVSSIFLLGLTLILASISIFILNRKVKTLENNVKSLQSISTSLSNSMKSLHTSNEVIIKQVKMNSYTKPKLQYVGEELGFN